MPFEFEQLALDGLMLVKPRKFKDERGYFMETYKESNFASVNIKGPFRQDNQSLSSKGVLRGLHYQLNPLAQGKLVWVVRGKLFDVGVDIRIGSPTYGKWQGVILSSANAHMLWLPEGFAHGICILEDHTILNYKVTNEFSPAVDRTILYNDPKIGIEWPLKNVSISEKDKNAPNLSDAENNFIYQEGNRQVRI
ncbi:MAG: dTDP-4-dehydrorhamnose 3,5-epimerase [Candidatus Heimdallarchaeota archaeon]|nr:dTDP-4-dehydrorhamnose 3,5-epimerase [Candidatus Heimdallarchaeota archaeon]